jgi:excisionase family DNA binding protein
MDDFVTLKQASDLLHVHPQTLRSWIKSKILTAYRPNPKGKLFIKQSDIDSMIKKGVVK